MEGQHQLFSFLTKKNPQYQSSHIGPTYRIISTGNCLYTVHDQNYACFCHQGLFVYDTGITGLRDKFKNCGHPLQDHANAQSVSKGKSIIIFLTRHS